MTLDPDDRRTLERAGRMHRQWRDKRDAAIIQAVRNGASLREVADAVGIAHSAVDRIRKQHGG